MSPQLGKFMKIDTLVENLEVDFLSLFFFGFIASGSTNTFQRGYNLKYKWVMIDRACGSLSLFLSPAMTLQSQITRLIVQCLFHWAVPPYKSLDCVFLWEEGPSMTTIPFCHLFAVSKDFPPYTFECFACFFFF